MAAKQILTWAALVIGITAMPALAQNAGGPPGGQAGQDVGPGGGGPGGFGGGPGGGGPGGFGGGGGGGFGGGGPGGFGGPGGGGPGGPGGNFDPAQFMQMRLQNIQQQLNVSDDEFQVLSPKIEKVLTLQQDARVGGRGRGGFGGPGGPGGPGGGFGGGPGGPGGPQTNNGQPLSAVQQARQELQAAIDDQTSSPDLLKSKLDAYRAAFAKAASDLTAAQSDLQSLLTQRQEAALVLSNILN